MKRRELLLQRLDEIGWFELIPYRDVKIDATDKVFNI